MNSSGSIVNLASIQRRCFPRAWLLLASLALAPSAHAESVIAFWDFNDGFSVPNESVQIVHNASIGSGTLYQQRADTDGNGKGGIAYSNPSLGIDVIDGRAMAWDDISKTGENDAEFFVEFSTIGFSAIRLRFDLQGNDDTNTQGVVSYDLKYDLDPLVDVVNPGDVIGTIKDFQDGTSNTIFNNKSLPPNGTSYVSEELDLTTLTALNNQSTVSIRLDDFDANDAMRIDNFTITGVTAIPEPSSAAVLLLMSGGLIAAGRRRRR